MEKLEKSKLKKILLQMREGIIAKVRNIEKENLNRLQKDAAGDLSGYGIHMADVASDNFERELSLGLAANERELLYNIDDALKRLNERDFGQCQACGKPIGIKRLSAVPYAVMCVACQEHAEKNKGQA
ncbi:MAG: TraR/DksA family transcriptional regulator [Candidatus Omnitrophica bacterium]|nr:TraR/DksA family transcriptional regulator [Candidatus Omnitrophota bacterium]